MANLTASLNYVDTTLDGLPVPTAASLQVYKGSIMGLDSATGLAVKFSDTATVRLLGISTAETLDVDARIDTRGVVLKRVNVTGVTAQTNVGGVVYVATDNPADFKTATNTNNKAVGWITRWYSGTLCDVKLRTPESYENQN